MELNLVTATIIGSFLSFLPSLIYNIISILISKYVKILQIDDLLTIIKMREYYKKTYYVSTSYSNLELMPIGWIIGPNYIIHCIDDKSMFMITNDDIINMIMSKTDDMKKDEDGLINRILYKRTPYHNSNYLNEIILTNERMECINPYQNHICNSIIKLYKKKNNVIVFLHGSPGTGKSMISDIVASRINGSELQCWEPYQPNNFLYMMLKRINPSKNNPLVILLDEVDMILENIHKGILLYDKHKELRIEISTKRDWNNLMDEINTNNPCKKHIYANIILIMTSNRSKKEIDSWDKSFLRKGRIDLCYQLKQKI